MSPRVLDAGDAAFTVEFGDAIDVRLLASVNALDAAVAIEASAGRLPGLVETMPTFRSLTVFFDPLATGRAALIDALQPLIAVAANHAAPLAGRRWRLPACYEGELGPDLAETARTFGIGSDELVALHAGTEYRVYMLGFLPGFPFMGDVPQRLRLPRRTEPRVRVPAGSVAIANALTAVYPWESPGGWHPLEHFGAAEIVSDATVPGSIQVPGKGQPIVLLADAQTAGGYPKIATVVGADLARVAQARPGQTLRFAFVGAAEAERIARDAEAETLALLAALRPLLVGGIDDAALYACNLVAGVLDALSAEYRPLTSQAGSAAPD